MTNLEKLRSLVFSLEGPYLHQFVLEVQTLESEADDAARRRVEVAVEKQLLKSDSTVLVKFKKKTIRNLVQN